jgi:hypothetical protein
MHLRNSKQPSNKIAILVKATEPSDYGPNTQWSDSGTAVTASRVTASRLSRAERSLYRKRSRVSVAVATLILASK